MTLDQKVQSRLVLLHNGNITHSHNCDITGPAIGTLAGMLLDPSISHCFIAGNNLYETLAELNALIQGNISGWRMRISNRRRQAITYDGQKRIVGRFFVDYFAIDHKRSRDERSPRRRYDVINLELFKDKPPEDPAIQMQMALTILRMAESRGVKFRGTRGSIANAMLKASPRWEDDRHAAPYFINRESRKVLPGNFYSVSNLVKTAHPLGGIPRAYYIDQSSAHHNIARTVPLPHPNHIRARGHYKRALKGEFAKWCTPDSEVGLQLMNGEHIGLVKCRLQIATLGKGLEHLYPPWASKRGTIDTWLWTPELRLIVGDQKIQLECFIAAYTATISDPVLPEYARWALGELKAHEHPEYIKATLLAAYGILAFNSDNGPLYRYWGGNNTKSKVEIPLAGVVGETEIKLPKHVQMNTVNVAARGVIEAETRTRSIEYARELNAMGIHIPQIYADGILAETDQLPFIPDGWRVSHELSNVYIPRVNAIVSDSLVKLPGVSGGSKGEWQDRGRDARRVLRATYARAYTAGT